MVTGRDSRTAQLQPLGHSESQQLTLVSPNTSAEVPILKRAEDSKQLHTVGEL